MYPVFLNNEYKNIFGVLYRNIEVTVHSNEYRIKQHGSKLWKLDGVLQTSVANERQTTPAIICHSTRLYGPKTRSIVSRRRLLKWFHFQLTGYRHLRWLCRIDHCYIDWRDLDKPAFHSTFGFLWKFFLIDCVCV